MLVQRQGLFQQMSCCGVLTPLRQHERLVIQLSDTVLAHLAKLALLVILEYEAALDQGLNGLPGAFDASVDPFLGLGQLFESASFVAGLLFLPGEPPTQRTGHGQDLLLNEVAGLEYGFRGRTQRTLYLLSSVLFQLDESFYPRLVLV